MKHFKNILVVAESDPATLQRAALLAKNNQAKLTLMHVVKEPHGTREHLQIGTQRINVQELVLEEMRRRLRLTADWMHIYGVRPDIKVSFGDPTHEIISHVVRDKFDFVIMTAESRISLRERLLGGISFRLIRKCPVPVMITKPDAPIQFKTILAAIDPYTENGAQDCLNASILQLSRECAEMESAELHVVNAWSLIGESILRGQSDVDGEDVDKFVQGEMCQRRVELLKLLGHHQIVNAKLHVLNGDPAHAISKLAAELSPDLLVMGTVCRTGIPGFIIGNTAERVLDSAQCSVLVVKPKGFVSPIMQEFT